MPLPESAAGGRTHAKPAIGQASVFAQRAPENRVADLTNGLLGDGRVPRRARQRTQPGRTDIGTVVRELGPLPNDALRSRFGRVLHSCVNGAGIVRTCKRLHETCPGSTSQNGSLSLIEI